MDKFILDYKIQHSMDERSKKIVPVESTNLKQPLNKNPYQGSNLDNQNDKKESFAQVLGQEIEKIKKR